MATQGLFMYNDKLYKQIDGETMGSCHGSTTLVNFFLGCLEEKLSANSNNLSPNLYLRYIDDIYAVFDSDSVCTQFLDILNSQHKDIKFTLEKNTNRENLPFLDVQKKQMTLAMTLAFGENPLILDCCLILLHCVRILENLV